ncbi:MAG: hypothetical protein ACREO4_12590 [Lysobacter sp.]
MNISNDTPDIIQTIPDIESREHNHHFLVHSTMQRHGRTYIGPEFDFVHWLRRSAKLGVNISNTDDSPYEVASNTKTGPLYRLTRLGRAIFLQCKSYNEAVASYYREHRFSPPLAVILRAVQQWGQALCDCIRGPDRLDVGMARAREILDQFAASVRLEQRSNAYKNELDNYKRNEEGNIASCCEYLAAQFERRSQLLILRIDLYFRPEFIDWGRTREADAHYSRFLRALREDRILSDVLGYIGKREDGIDRGIHYHVLIVVDGHKHRDAANLTRIVGEDWVNRCGQGRYFDCGDGHAEGIMDRASYFNCYARASEYRYNGLGLVRPTDADKLRGLRCAVDYLCKEETQLKPTPLVTQEPDRAQKFFQRGARNLRKGIMPKGHSGRGAPRRSSLDTSIIERELLKR